MRWLAGLLLLGLGCFGDPVPLDERFATEIRPFFDRYCFSCHGPNKKKGDVDLSRDFSIEAIAKSPKLWDQVQARIHEKEMPPEDARQQPRDGEREGAIAWLKDLGDREAARNAGDPGFV